MKISLQNIGKRYNSEWIFKDINLEFSSNDSYAILGGNGSGKSTFLQILAGNFIPSEGKISYSFNSKEISSEDVFKHISIATPYLELFEEFTLKEQIEFHSKFKRLRLPGKKIIERLYLETAVNKSIKYFSSGMKQRVKLALAILSDCPILLLDEPTSNLDHKAIEWYQRLISDFGKGKLIFVCSNKIANEYSFCTKVINIEEYKLSESERVKE